MPLYRVLKTLDLGKGPDGRKIIKQANDTVELDQRRGDWLMAQHKAVAPIGSVADVPALMKPKPIVHRRCCGR